MASLPLGWRTKLPSPWPTLILEMDLKISTNFNMLWIFRMDPRKTNCWNHAKMCGLGYVFFLFQGWKHQTNMFGFSGFRCPIHTPGFHLHFDLFHPQISSHFQFHWSLGSSEHHPTVRLRNLRLDLPWKEPTSGMRLCWLPMAATWQTRWSSGWNVECWGKGFLRLLLVTFSDSFFPLGAYPISQK